jgi:hypothetical protein
VRPARTMPVLLRAHVLLVSRAAVFRVQPLMSAPSDTTLAIFPQRAPTQRARSRVRATQATLARV